jgi:hypothetical protein
MRKSIPVTSDATVHPDLPSLFLLSFFSVRRCAKLLLWLVCELPEDCLR